MLTLEDKKLEDTLIELSKETGKSIKEILSEAIESISKKYIKKSDKLEYKKLNPKEYSQKINYEIDNSLIDESVKPFSDVKDVIKFSKELREKNWRF